MIEVIPAIDILGGKCVRLRQGDFETARLYNEPPLAMARRFEAAGFTRLHLVDLDGARAGKVMNWQVLEDIASNTKLQIDFSGGVRSEEDINRAFELGAAMVTIGSLAAVEPDKVLEFAQKFGAEKIIVALDCDNGSVVTKGWQQKAETSFDELANKYIATGINKIICTDVQKDGMLQGPSLALYKQALQSAPGIKLIASGGVSRPEDIQELEAIGCYGVIVGKAIYEGRIKLEELAAL